MYIYSVLSVSAVCDNLPAGYYTIGLWFDGYAHTHGRFGFGTYNSRMYVEELGQPRQGVNDCK